MFSNMEKKLLLRVQDLRPLNRSAMLRLLRDEGVGTRVSVARALRLSHSAVTNIAADLIADGVLHDGPLDGDAGTETRVGRPATSLTIVPQSRLVLGVQVGVGVARLVVCDLFARIIDRREVTFPAVADPGEGVRAVTAGLRELIAGLGADAGKLLGVGIGAPRLYDAATHTKANPIAPGWADQALAERLSDELELPVVVDHNVRTMALAEARFGAFKGVESLAFLYVSTGVGAGLIIDGQPYRGGTHGVTELGHLPVVPGGPTCRCGNRGCLEAVASEPAIAALATARATGGELRDLIAGGQSPTQALIAAAEMGDRTALSIYDQVAAHLADGLVSIVNLLNPEVIVTGGFADLAGQGFLDRLHAAVIERAFPTLRSDIRIEPTSFGPDVGAIGGATVALDQLFYAPHAGAPTARPSHTSKPRR